MARLLNRNMQIPNGMTFYVPELDWRPRAYSSFSGIVDALIHLIRANPRLQNKYPLDKRQIEDMVDNYNATLCAQMGWTEYIEGGPRGGSVPKHSTEVQNEMMQGMKLAAAKARELMNGAKSVTEWAESGEAPVPKEQAAGRALICAECPMNEQGDFTKWFSVSASELMRRQIDTLEKRSLSTPDDHRVNVCMACSGSIRVNVHLPIKFMVKALTPEQRARMANGRNCWVLAESP